MAKRKKPSARALREAAQSVVSGRSAPVLSSAGGYGRFLALGPERRSEIGRMGGTQKGVNYARRRAEREERRLR